MDSEFPHSDSFTREPPHNENKEPASVLEQVRELLFGEAHRTTAQTLRTLEDKIAAMTATMEARFSELEKRLQDARDEIQHGHSASIDEIGGAIAELGAKIREVSTRRVAS